MLCVQFFVLTILFCAVEASLFDSILGSKKKSEEIVIGGIIQNDGQSETGQSGTETQQETGLALLENGQSDAQLSDDLTIEGDSNGVVIRAKRYYGCGCGCCGCASVAPVTAMPCGCGCCGCGYG